MEPANLPELGLSVLTIPKNGGTTLLHWIHFLRTGRNSSENVYQQKWLFEGGLLGETLIVRRDPVERFISGYRNFRDKRGLELGFDDFVRQVPELVLDDDDLWHHFAPQSEYYPSRPLGEVDHVFDFGDFEGIREFLSERAGRELPRYHEQKSRFQDFEVTEDQVASIRQYYVKDYLAGFGEGGAGLVDEGQGLSRGSEVPKLHAIVGTMRSGTTLLGHLLAEAGWVRYAGESHVRYDGGMAVGKAWERIQASLPEEGKNEEERPFCDKVVIPGHLPDGGQVLIEKAERIYLILRHPLAVWRSLTSLGWEWARWEYVVKQLRVMKEVARSCPVGKLTVISYDELTCAEKRKALFGREIESYGILPKTGVANWGDPEKLIRSGEIREMSLEEDYERAFAEVGEAVSGPGFGKAMAVYGELVRMVGRAELLEVGANGPQNLGRKLAEKYAGLKKWGWYFGLEEWKMLFYTEKRVRVLEVGAFDGVSANMMLDHLFVHPESEVICIDPFLPDPTTPQVCGQTKKDFYENRRRGGHEGRIEIFEGLSVEVLAWMISEEGYWDSFDFIYIDGSHLAKDVLTDAVMSWNLLKYGGVIAFDDYEWNGGSGELGRPKAGIDAFASVFGPELKLVKGGYRRIWQKLVCE